MIDIDKEQPTIKQYLLGRLDEEGRQRFEERFVSDPEFREVALVIEDELIEDYLADLLTAEEQESFASHYLSAPQQLEELRLSQALREYATQGAAAGTPDAAARGRHRIINLLLGKGRAPVLAFVLLLLVALAVWWGLAGREHRIDQRAAVDAEVTLLNRQSLGNESALTLTLTSVIRRDPHQGQKVLIPEGINIVQFLLSLPGQQHQSYDITLRTYEGHEVFTVSGLHAEDAGGERRVKLKTPARLLTPGDYLLELKGVDAPGQAEAVAEYFFRVVK